MNVTQSNRKDPVSKKKFIFGAFSLSMVVHFILLFLVGGAVLVQGVIPKKGFMAEDIPVAEESVSEVAEAAPEEMPADVASPELVKEEAVPAFEPTAEVPIVTQVISVNASAPLPNSMPASSISSVQAPATTPNAAANSKPAPNNGLRKMSSLFGSKETTSDALVGYLYDLKQTPERKPTDMAELPGEGDVMGTKPNNMYWKVIKDFISDWNPNKLRNYYKSPSPLSTSQFFIPTIPAAAAPKAFDVEKDVKARRWLVHYSGRVVAPTSGSFRFVGLGDDVLIVRFNSRTVIDASWVVVEPQANDKSDNGPIVGNSRILQRVGEWFHVDEGKTYPIEVLIGECPGGSFTTILLVQQKGKEYKTRQNGKGLILPVFQTALTQLPDFKIEGTAPEVTKDPFVFGMDK